MKAEIIIGLVIFAGICFYVFLLVSLAGSFISARRQTNNFKKFSLALKAAFQSKKMNREDIKQLMLLYHIGETELLQALRQNLSDSFSAPQAEKIETDEIRKYLAWHTEEKPFSELPEDIQIQMEAIKIEVPSMGKRLRDLAISLTDLYLRNRQDLSKQMRYTFWGFVVGIVGVVLAVIFGILSISMANNSIQSLEPTRVNDSSAVERH